MQPTHVYSTAEKQGGGGRCRCNVMVLLALLVGIQLLLTFTSEAIDENSTPIPTARHARADVAGKLSLSGQMRGPDASIGNLRKLRRLDNVSILRSWKGTTCFNSHILNDRESGVMDVLPHHSDAIHHPTLVDVGGIVLAAGISNDLDLVFKLAPWQRVASIVRGAWMAYDSFLTAGGNLAIAVEDATVRITPCFIDEIRSLSLVQLGKKYLHLRTANINVQVLKPRTVIDSSLSH